MKHVRRMTMAGALALTVLLTPALISLTQNEPRNTRPEVRTPIEPPGAAHPAAMIQPPVEPQAEPWPVGTADVRLLGVNDFHGNLEPVGGAGGAAYLAAYMDEHARRSPGGAIRVHAGDMVGVSPLISSHFHDEPTVLAANRMDFDIGTVGNHEFDEGGEEMLRLINGGQRNDGNQFKDGADGRPINTSDPDFPGADFPYVAANTRYAGSGESVLPPYRILERDGARVGFIGVTTMDTPKIVQPKAVGRFRFLDISDTVNRYAAELQAEGVEAIVVLAHAGGAQLGPDEAVGEVFDETEQMTDAVDVVVAGHTHNKLNLRVGSKLVVEAGKYGTAFSSVDLKIDRATGDVTRSAAEILTTDNAGMEPDPAVSALVEERRREVAPISERVVGTAAGDVKAAETEAGESALGDLVADSERAAADADLAFVISGGLREDISAGPVTYGDLFSVQPQEDRLVKMTLTGREVYEELERQLEDGGHPMQVSGLRFVYDSSKPTGPRVLSATLPDGTPLDRDADYTVVVKGFLADGGGEAAVFERGRDREVVGKDIEALAEYVEGLPQPFTAPDPAVERRMTDEGRP